jgi:hypothetical protein
MFPEVKLYGTQQPDKMTRWRYIKTYRSDQDSNRIIFKCLIERRVIKKRGYMAGVKRYSIQ